MILCVTINPCVDRTIWLRSLAPTGVMRGVKTRVVAGGKGNNVARVLRRLGHDVVSLNLLGQETGAQVANLITREDDASLCAVWIQNPTREVVTVVEENTHRQAAYVEPGPEVTPAERDALMRACHRLIDRADWIVLSGSAPLSARTRSS